MMTHRLLRAAALAAATAVAAGCATTQFKTFAERGSTQVSQGAGGQSAWREGMEVWESGEPQRRYKVLGVIEDERPVGWVSSRRLHLDVVRKAREVGGEALIDIGRMPVPAAASGVASAGPARQAAQFLVIQYLD